MRRLDARSRGLAAIVLVVLTMLSPAPGVDAQPGPRTYRVGVLETTAAESNVRNLSAFRDGLRELGYAEGRNLVIEYRSSDDRNARLPQLAADLVAHNVDVIVARGDQAALSARHTTRTIPIVMATSGDPVASGIVRNLARPGENVTGLHMMAPAGVATTRLRLLMEIIPKATRVAILTTPVNLHSEALIKDAEASARRLGIHLVRLDYRGRSELDQAFEAALMERVDGLITVEDYFSATERARIVEFAAMSRLPAIYGLREFVDAGGLLAYGVDRRDLFRRAAGYVDKILKGARAGDLAIEGPVRFELVGNAKTARALGIAMPPDVLRRLDELIQ